MNKLYYVRHGESVYNAQKRYAGSTDVALSELGEKQAEEVGKQLQNFNIDVIIASPQKRAQQTAKIINKYLNLNILSHSDIREISVGLYEGLTRDEAAAKYPERWKQGTIRSFTHAPHDGESAQDVQNRVFNALDEILKEHKGKNILVVAHGFVGKAVYRYFNREITDDEFYSFSLTNCSVKEYCH